MGASNSQVADPTFQLSPKMPDSPDTIWSPMPMWFHPHAHVILATCVKFHYNCHVIPGLHGVILFGHYTKYLRRCLIVDSNLFLQSAWSSHEHANAGEGLCQLFKSAFTCSLFYIPLSEVHWRWFGGVPAKWSSGSSGFRTFTLAVGDPSSQCKKKKKG